MRARSAVHKLRYHAQQVPTALFGAGEAKGKARRAYAFALLRRLTPVAAVDRDGSRFLVWTGDRGVSRDTFIEQGFDAAVMESLLGLVGQHSGRSFDGRVFVDVGANIGTTTVEALRRFGFGRALAFEPEPGNLALLRSNIALNGLVDRVTVEPIALSDRGGTAVLALSSENSGDHRIAAGRNAVGRSTVEVAVERLDDALARLGVAHDDIGLVWIDTQGHEASVLAGAPLLLAADIPLVMEYWPFGLVRSGGLEQLHERVAGAFASFIDVRGDRTPRPIAELPRLASQYRAEHEFTDLVLLHD